MSEPDVPWRGKFLEISVAGTWEWAARRGHLGAAVILAVDDGHVLFVEQDRKPLGVRTIELPAGLVGDQDAAETVEAAAARELEEETGWRPARVETLGVFATSPGMTSETFTLIRATGLEKVGEGGGEGEEDITVHRVSLADVPRFVADKRAAGVMIDARVLLVLAASILG